MPSSAEKEAINKQTNPSRGSSTSSASASAMAGNRSRTNSGMPDQSEGVKRMGTPEPMAKECNAESKLSQMRLGTTDPQVTASSGGCESIAGIRAQIIAHVPLLFRGVDKPNGVYPRTGPQMTSDTFDVVVARQPGKGGLGGEYQAYLMHFDPVRMRAPAMAGEGVRKSDLQAALYSLLEATAEALTHRHGNLVASMRDRGRDPKRFATPSGGSIFLDVLEDRRPRAEVPEDR